MTVKPWTKMGTVPFFLFALLATAQDAPVSERMPLTRVAVMVYPTSEAAKPLATSAQSRLEQILNDNGVEVTDRDEAKKIKSIWKKLEDPGYFVTADDFVKNAGSYQLDGIVRVYLSADSAPAPGGFFSATAQADVRLIDEDAKVQAQVSFPMGAPGRPPSDGLTTQAALLNAIQSRYRIGVRRTRHLRLPEKSSDVRRRSHLGGHVRKKRRFVRAVHAAPIGEIGPRSERFEGFGVGVGPEAVRVIFIDDNKILAGGGSHEHHHAQGKTPESLFKHCLALPMRERAQKVT
jgi:hypothetical protein